MVASGSKAPAPSAVDPTAPFIERVLSGLTRALASAGAGAIDVDSVMRQVDLDGGPEGDAAFPVHRAAAAAKVRPEEFATRIATAFPPAEGIASVSSKGAYVNFRFDATELTRTTLDLVLSRGPEYGHGPSSDAPLVCIEHTSANPTGPFHIGRVRNGIIGDTLARVVRASGTPVVTQYYVDDMGRQATIITWIWSKPRSQWPEPIRRAVDGEEVAEEKVDRHWGRPYPAASAYLKEHPEAQAEVAELMRKVETGSPDPRHRELSQQILDGMLASLARLGIAFDEFVWESDFLRDGSVDRVLEKMRAAPHAVREENGAWAIDASSYGLPKESTHVVFQRADGTSLYVLRDIAYHLTKFARFARVVDVLGQDHQLHARTLDALLAEYGEPRRPTYLIYQDITVPEGGRMSTRKGSAVWLDQLLEEAVERARHEVLERREDLAEADVERIAEAVATGAIRYQIVRVAPEKPVVFRWEEALSFEGRSGPFVQYSYARASSVLRKSGEAGGPFEFHADRLKEPDELELVRVIARLPRTVAYAARSGHVQAIAGYAHDLADQFNRFYHAVPVLRSGDERQSRLALVAAARQALGNTLDLLGVARLESM
jgi:arginyl-tRNA synthetase